MTKIEEHSKAHTDIKKADNIKACIINILQASKSLTADVGSSSVC